MKRAPRLTVVGVAAVPEQVRKALTGYTQRVVIAGEVVRIVEAFTPLGFLLRLLAAIVLVLCTFNPSGYSYVHWVATVFPHISPAQAIVGIVLLVGWIVYLTATMRSIGVLGVVIGVAFFAAVVWLIVSWGWIDPHNTTAMTWVVLFICAAILAVGISWSHIRRRLTGQTDVDEIEPHR